MDNSEAANAALVREYLAAIEEGTSGDAKPRFFTEDAVQVELPNRLNPTGAESDLARMRKRAALGRQLLREQHFEIVSEVAQGDRVAVEARWSGVLAVAAGTLAAVATMKAHFAMFFEFAGGRIRRQRNYDCFGRGSRAGR